jgi:hypothetical protein
MATMISTPRNALAAAFEAAQTLSDLASDAENLLDIWSKRQPLQLADGQIYEMKTILRDAHAALVEAKEAFKAATDQDGTLERSERLLRLMAGEAVSA